MSMTNAKPANRAMAPGGSAHELDAPPWRRVESTLISAANGIREVYDRRLDHLDLTLSLASLLAYIAEFGPVSQTRAADHLAQGRAVTGTQIDRLESRGLIERRPDPDDRRVWLIVATDTGITLAARVAEVDRILRAELRDGVSRSDRQLLAGLLMRLQHNLNGALERTVDTPHPTPNQEQ